MAKIKFKLIETFDPVERKVRLFRLIWKKGEVGKGGYSSFLSLSLLPRLFKFEQDFNEWRLTLLGISLHKKVSYGGVFT